MSRCGSMISSRRSVSNSLQRTSIGLGLCRYLRFGAHLKVVMSQSLSQMHFLTVGEVAQMMRVSTMTVYRLVHSGELPAVRFGRSFRIPESAVSTLVFSAGEVREIGEVG